MKRKGVFWLVVLIGIGSVSACSIINKNSSKTDTHYLDKTIGLSSSKNSVKKKKNFIANCQGMLIHPN